MTTAKDSALPSASTVVTTDTLVVVQGGVSKKAATNLLPVSASQQTALDLKQNLSLKDQANGYAGLDSSGNLVGTLISRKGTAAAINAIVLADGELAFTSDTKEMRLGDGVTSGGLFFGVSGWTFYSNPWPALTTSGSVLNSIAVSTGTYEYWLQMHMSDARTVTVAWQAASAANNAMISPMPAYGGALGLADSAIKIQGSTILHSGSASYSGGSITRILVGSGNSSASMRGFVAFTGISTLNLQATVDVNSTPAGSYLFGVRRVA